MEQSSLLYFDRKSLFKMAQFSFSFLRQFELTAALKDEREALSVEQDNKEI